MHQYFCFGTKSTNVFDTNYTIFCDCLKEIAWVLIFLNFRIFLIEQPWAKGGRGRARIPKHATRRPWLFLSIKLFSRREKKIAIPSKRGRETKHRFLKYRFFFFLKKNFSFSSFPRILTHRVSTWVMETREGKERELWTNGMPSRLCG